MNKQSFSSRTILFTLGIVVLAVVGWFGYSMIASSNDSQMTEDKMMKDDGMMHEDSMEGESMMEEGSYGKVLAGTSSPFVEFSQAGYAKALTDGKIVFLDFYANWCPICRAEAPVIDAGFNSLTTDQVVGFRVNFKDSDTDADEAALAQKFNVPYQHTKVIVQNGNEVFRSTDQWKKEDFDKAINQVLN